MTPSHGTRLLLSLTVCLLSCTRASLCLRPLLFLLVVPGVPLNGNEFLDLCANVTAGDNPDPHFQRKEPQIILELLRPHREEVIDTEEEDKDGSDTIDPGDLQEYVQKVLATCMDKGEIDVAIPGVDNSQLETACLTLAELPEALEIVPAARRGDSDSNRHSRCSPGGKGKTRQTPGRQRVHSNARDQRHHDDRPAQVVGRAQRARPQPRQQRYGFASKVGRTKGTQRLSCVWSARTCGHETLNAQVALLT